MPLNWKASGTSPSSRAWKYFTQARPRSKLDGTRTSASVLPLKRCTWVVAIASTMVRTVFE